MSGVDAIKEKEVSIDLFRCAVLATPFAFSLSGQFIVIACSRTSEA